MAQEIEVFASESGRLSSAWDLDFSEHQSRGELGRCSHAQPDGSFREGTIRYTLEVWRVGFLTSSGSVVVGDKGQLSSPGDCFYDVTVSSIEKIGDVDLVLGEASRRSNPFFDSP